MASNLLKTLAMHWAQIIYIKKTIPVGSCKFSDIATFSFHPVKSITTAEGGMITTNNLRVFQKLKLLRNHGILRKKNSAKNTNGIIKYYILVLIID